MKTIFLIFLLYSPYLYAKTIPLVFKGNSQIGERELYLAINLYKPYFYEFFKTAPAINEKVAPLTEQTILNYYKSKGFYHAKVSSASDEKRIAIIIEENAPLRIATITISSELPLDSVLPFSQGDIFDASKFTQSKKDVRIFYAKQSFCNAELDAKAYVNLELNSAKLVYKVVPNKVCSFGKIEITPSKTIDKEILKSLLYVKENAPFSLEDVSKSYKNLYAHPGVSSALINTNVDKNATVDINVSVSENENPIRFQSSLGYSSDQGAMLALGIEDRNFYGNLKTLGLQAKLTQIYQSLKLNYSMPLQNRDAFGGEVGVKDEKYLGFKEVSSSGTLYLEQRDFPNAYKESLFFDNAYTYDSEDLELFPNGNLFILSPKLGWARDERDNLLNPTSGYFVNAEIAGSLLSPLSDASYAKLTLSGGYILPLFKSNYLAMKATFGSLNLYEGSIPPSYRFYAGGTYSNRAYSYRRLGQNDGDSNPVGFNSLLEATVEYRFPIYGEIRGVAFSDNTAIGNKIIPEYSDTYNSVGLGLRYNTPIGPIALDFGADLANPRRQYAFSFHIGELF